MINRNRRYFEEKFGQGITMIEVLKRCYLENDQLDIPTVVDILRKMEIDSIDLESEKKRYDLAIEELSLEDKEDSATAQNDPILERARELALIVDAFNSLAHIHTICGEERRVDTLQNQLRFGKDFFMRRLAEHCLTPEGIEHGLRVGIKRDDGNRYKRERKSTLEVDLPYVGHLKWHFGKELNLIGFRKDMATFLIEKKFIDVEEHKRETFIEMAKDTEFFLWYSNPLESRSSENRKGYSNIDLLVGMTGDKVNDIDRNLIYKGVVTTDVQHDGEGNIKLVSMDRLYGVKYIMERMNPKRKTNYIFLDKREK